MKATTAESSPAQAADMANGPATKRDPQPGSLQWLRGGDYFQITRCNRFTVALCLVDQVKRFVAYDLTKETLSRPAERIGIYDRPSAARASCARRARKYDAVAQGEQEQRQEAEA